MNLLRPASVVILIAAVSLGPLTPAHAAPQPLFGTTVDVIATASGDDLLGSTAHVPVGGGALLSILDVSLSSDVAVTLLDGATTIDTCTIPAGGSACGLLTGGALPPGPTVVTMRFTMDATTVEYTGTIFAVTSTAPTVDLEWQDAAGTWVNGSGLGLPLRGDTALRCVVTNSSNASVTYDGFSSTINLVPAASETVAITGTLAAGETGYHPVWSGPASAVSSASCSGGVSLRDGTGTGSGNGGGVVAVGGTITIDPTPAPGVTVTVSGNDLTPPIVTGYRILVDGAEVAGSPVTTSSPDFDFALDVPIPASLAPGDHAVTVVAAYDGREIVFAAFPFEVDEPQLAATGVAHNASAIVGVALALLVAGTVVLLRSSSRRRAA